MVGEDNVTHYQGFVGRGALFEINQPVSIRSVTDGTSNTLMIAEALKPVPWTKPEDVSFKSGDVSSRLGGHFKDGFLAVTADGSPRFMKKSIDPHFLAHMITRDGSEVIDRSIAGEGIQVP